LPVRDQTDSLLTDIGYDATAIADLRERKVLVGSPAAGTSPPVDITGHGDSARRPAYGYAVSAREVLTIVRE